MHKQHTRSPGFTIVELLIVIVVIAILAAISTVAYRGMQSRARDTQRLTDVKTITRALHAYRAVNNAYPSSNPPTGPNNTCGSDHTNGYSYSTSTDGHWMPALIGSGIVSNLPTAPGNNCGSFYRYLQMPGNAYGCTARTTDYALLQVFGVEGMTRPSDAIGTTVWRPCVEATVGWASDATTWTFIFEE